jgi:hypothetical protein
MKAQRVNGSGHDPDARPLSLRNVRSATRAALHNEALTRQRVDALEQDVAILKGDEAVFHRFMVGLTFWERLRWVICGR